MGVGTAQRVAVLTGEERMQLTTDDVAVGGRQVPVEPSYVALLRACLRRVFDLRADVGQGQRDAQCHVPILLPDGCSNAFDEMIHTRQSNDRRSAAWSRAQR